MLSGPSNFTRSKIHYTDLVVNELQFQSLHPKPPAGKLNRRQSGIFTPLRKLKQEDNILSPIPIDSIPSENQQQAQMTEQEFDSEYEEQLSQLGPALAAVKQIEEQLLEKIPQFDATTDSIDDWLGSVELILL